MTHAELVARAVKWLYNTRKCQVVFAERTAWGGPWEVPDAIGFRSSESILVECKTSRGDFHRDQLKPYRHAVMRELGLGGQRFYLTPKGLLVPDELPEGWGLLEVRGKIIRVVKKSEGFGNHWRRLRGEIALLVSALNPNSSNKVEATAECTKVAAERLSQGVLGL